MSCKKPLYAGFDTVVSVDALRQSDTIRQQTLKKEE